MKYLPSRWLTLPFHADCHHKTILSEYQYAEKQSQKPPSLVTILQKAVAKRQEAVEAYRSAKPSPRHDLAEKEEEHIRLIRTFLPAEMSAAEIREVAEKVMGELGLSADSKGAIGRIMGEMSKRVDKARAPGSAISAVVKELLGGK